MKNWKRIDWICWGMSWLMCIPGGRDIFYGVFDGDSLRFQVGCLWLISCLFMNAFLRDLFE